MRLRGKEGSIGIKHNTANFRILSAKGYLAGEDVAVFLPFVTVGIAFGSYFVGSQPYFKVYLGFFAKFCPSF